MPNFDRFYILLSYVCVTDNVLSLMVPIDSSYYYTIILSCHVTFCLVSVPGDRCKTKSHMTLWGAFYLTNSTYAKRIESHLATFEMHAYDLYR